VRARGHALSNAGGARGWVERLASYGLRVRRVAPRAALARERANALAPSGTGGWRRRPACTRQRPPGSAPRGTPAAFASRDPARAHNAPPPAQAGLRACHAGPAAFPPDGPAVARVEGPRGLTVAGAATDRERPLAGAAPCSRFTRGEVFAADTCRPHSTAGATARRERRNVAKVPFMPARTCRRRVTCLVPSRRFAQRNLRRPRQALSRCSTVVRRASESGH
jgi:hypothetical protein